MKTYPQLYPRLTELKVEQVVHVPRPLVHGVLYVSQRFETSLHLCACGCGEQVVTPQPRDVDSGWVRTGTEDCVTLRPSIGNPWCGAHYYVTENRIDWL